MSKRQEELFPDLTSDKKYVSDYPELVAEWHPTRNGNKSTEDVRHRSNKLAWWQCEEGHEWAATIDNRRRGTGCPYCAGRKPSPEYNFAALHPDLLAEWDYKKNSTPPDKFLPRSGKLVWWCCQRGHEWQAAISSRPRNGCPYCSGLYVLPGQSLADLNPTLCQQWDYEKNEKDPSEYAPKSGKKVWWRCPNGEDHSWLAVIHSRTSEDDGLGVGCPFCSGKQASATYNLASVRPDLAAEWHPSKNLKAASDFTPFSNRRVWWMCDRGHEWQTAINNRSNGRRCPKCNNQTSLPEVRLFTEISGAGFQVLSRHKLGGIEVDLFLPELNAAIEYDGRYWHSEKAESDALKQANIEAKGIRLIRIREHPLPKINDVDIIVSPHRELSKRIIDRLLSCLAGQDKRVVEYRKLPAFANEQDYLSYVELFPSPFPEKSLAAQNPQLSSQWHPTKNGPLAPTNFTPRSGQSVWWFCENGHEWRARIDGRNGPKKTGCPYCSKTNRKVSPETSMVTTRPDLALMFHKEKNLPISPENVVPGTSKKLWWKCEHGHEWQASGDFMARPKKGPHCPKCRQS